MRKIFHESLHDWVKPQNSTEPVYVLATHCHVSEINAFVLQKLQKLKPFTGKYQLVVEFSEPQTDTRFNVGHVGAVITVRAETEELAKQMQAIL
jgi:hypothetical protein